MTVPLPLVGGVIARNAELLAAVHGHPGCVVSVTLPLPPATGADRCRGLSEDQQPDWLTVKVWPAIVIVPDRGAVTVVAATE